MQAQGQSQRKVRRHDVRLDRARDIAKKYRSGMTQSEIGDYYGISRERARQILANEFGITKKDGGKAQRARSKARAANTRKEMACFQNYGMSLAAFNAMQRGQSKKTGPYRKFMQQRASAARRGIEWNLTLAEWWAIWQESGKWAQRGRGKHGYVMARHGDTGSYEVGNVKIIRANENQSEYIRRYWKQVNSGERPAPRNSDQSKYRNLEVGQTVVREIGNKRGESERCHAYIIAKRLGWKVSTSVRGGVLTVTRTQ